MPSLPQYPAHLLQPFVEVGEVADAEGCHDSVEGVVRVGERRTVFFLKRDDILQALSPHFLPADIHHTFRDIRSDKSLGLEHLCGKDGEVTRSCCDIKHRLWLVGLELLDSLPAPPTVYVP